MYIAKVVTYLHITQFYMNLNKTLKDKMVHNNKIRR